MSMLICEKGRASWPPEDQEARLQIDRQRELVFQDYRVPADQPGRRRRGPGLQARRRRLELGRINVAARGAGIAAGRAARCPALRAGAQTFGKPIASTRRSS
jgi:alkylation response protein AidB-like acyl-CoA dehydrogenase